MGAGLGWIVELGLCMVWKLWAEVVEDSSDSEESVVIGVRNVLWDVGHEGVSMVIGIW
jgi:hypothetical protein